MVLQIPTKFMHMSLFLHDLLYTMKYNLRHAHSLRVVTACQSANGVKFPSPLQPLASRLRENITSYLIFIFYPTTNAKTLYDCAKNEIVLLYLVYHNRGFVLYQLHSTCSLIDDSSLQLVRSHAIKWGCLLSVHNTRFVPLLKDGK